MAIEAYITGMKWEVWEYKSEKISKVDPFSSTVVTGFIAFTKFILDPEKLDRIY